jgi:hypothetical protein
VTPRASVTGLRDVYEIGTYAPGMSLREMSLKLSMHHRSSSLDMADPQRDSRPELDTRTPRWVKVFGIVFVVVVLLFVILMLTGHHRGPRDHMPSGHTPRSGHG